MSRHNMKVLVSCDDSVTIPERILQPTLITNSSVTGVSVRYSHRCKLR